MSNTKIRANQADVEEILNDPSAAASEIKKGSVQLATQAEVNAGSDTLKVVTPNTLSNSTLFEPADGTILKDADIGVTVEGYDATILKDVDIGISVAAQAHTHTGVYEPVDATILRSADIGVTVASQSHTHILDNLTDVALGSPPLSGQSLTFNGLNWTNTDTIGLFTEDANYNIVGGTSAGTSLGAGANSNIGMGFLAIQSTSSGDYNIGIGASALKSNTVFSNNLAIGRFALENSDGNSNIAIGSFAGRNFGAATGFNTLLGVNAGAGISAFSSNDNVAIGFQALNTTTASTTANNTVVGARSANSISGGYGNVILGHSAGDKITSGDNNLVLGIDAGPTTNKSNELYINNAESDTPLIHGSFASAVGSPLVDAAVTIHGALTVADQLLIADGTDAIPALAFSSDTDTGIYFVNPGEVHISTGGVDRLGVLSDGSLSVAGTTNYENLVTTDDDIPNKKYVDDAIGTGIGASTLGQLLDVSTSGSPALTHGDVLTYSTAGSPPVWKNIPIQFTELFDDKSPQLGGDLDGNGFTISVDNSSIGATVIRARALGGGANKAIEGITTSPTGLGGFFENQHGSDTEVSIAAGTIFIKGELDGVEKFSIDDTGAATFDGGIVGTAGGTTAAATVDITGGATGLGVHGGNVNLTGGAAVAGYLGGNIILTPGVGATSSAYHGNIQLDGDVVVLHAGSPALPVVMDIDNTLARVAINGLASDSAAALQVAGDIHVDGGVNYRKPDNTVPIATYRGGTNFFILRDYSDLYTIQQIWSPPGEINSGSPATHIEREATLALVRGDEPNQEFVDFYNNGYLDETQFGMRMQKRGTGEYRPFVFDYYDGVTKSTVLTIDTTGATINGTFNVATEIQLGGSALALHHLADVSNTGSPVPTVGDVLTYTAGSPPYWTNTAPFAGNNWLTANAGSNFGVAPTSGTYSIAMGEGSTATGVRQVAIGHSVSMGTGAAGIAIGDNVNIAAGASNIAIGDLAQTIGNFGNQISIGNASIANNNNATAIGNGAKAYATRSAAFGYRAETVAAATDALAIGSSVQADKLNQIVIGKELDGTKVPVDYDRSVKLGTHSSAALRNILHLHSKGKLELVGDSAQFIMPNYAAGSPGALPETADKGGLVYDTTADGLLVYTGSPAGWVSVGGGGVTNPLTANLDTNGYGIITASSAVHNEDTENITITSGSHYHRTGDAADFGNITITAGNNSGYHKGGTINLVGGDGTGGSVGFSTDAEGGDINLTAGVSTVSVGGVINITGGVGNTISGGVNITGGSRSGAVGQDAGPIVIKGGDSQTGTPGKVSILGGDGYHKSANAGDIDIIGGNNSYQFVVGAYTDRGGNVLIQGGYPNKTISTTYGGNVKFVPGEGGSAANHGAIQIGSAAGNGYASFDILDDVNSYKTTVKVASLGSDTIFQLPATNGTVGQVLTAGSPVGVTSWADASGGVANPLTANLDTGGFQLVTANVSGNANTNPIGLYGGTNTYAGGNKFAGSAYVIGGNATNGNWGGYVGILAGHGTGAGSKGGNVFIESGRAYSGATTAGYMSIKGGSCYTTGGNGGAIDIRAGSATDATGGTTTIRGGNATNASGTGGNVEIVPGGGVGGTTDGAVQLHTAHSKIGQASLQFWNDTNTAHTTGNYVELKAPSAVGSPADITITLPNSVGADGEVLTTDGNGTTSWTDPADTAMLMAVVFG